MKLKLIFFGIYLSVRFFGFSDAEGLTLLRHGGAVKAVAFSPIDPAVCASAGDSNTIKLWDLRDDTETTLRGHRDEIDSVAFSPDGTRLVSASDDATLKMWDISRWQEIETLEPITIRMPSRLDAVAFSPDGNILAATAGRDVNLLDIVNWTEIARLAHDAWVRALAFSPDGQFLAAGDDGGLVTIWDVQQRDVIAKLQGDMHIVYAVVFSPDGRTLASAGVEGQIKLWTTSDGSLLGTLENDWGGTVFSLDFTPDGKVLASVGYETVRLWSVESGEEITALTGHSGWVNAVAFSPDGKTLASGGDDGSVRVQNIESYLQQQRGIVRLIYFLPSDRPPQPDIDAKMDTLIKEAQLAYAEIMARHRFGRKTFRFETDVNGKAVVHHIVGRFTDAHYRNLPYTWDIWEEIEARFDVSTNIYLTAIDISSEVLDGGGVCGRGGHRGFGGRALIPMGECFNVDVIAHELGHAFGLPHDYRRNPKRVLSSYTADEMIRSFCAAEWLDAHRYFNTYETGFNEPTTIQMYPPQAVPPNEVRLRFEVTDPDGLHQAQLIALEFETEFEKTGGLIACQRLNTTSSTVDFVVPTSALKYSSEITLQVIDQQGNFSSERFYGDLKAGPKIEGPWVWVIVPTGTYGSAAATSGVDYLSEASDGVVSEKQVAAKGATAGEAVGNSVWHPGTIDPAVSNNITELVNDMGLGAGDIDNHVAYGCIALGAPRTQQTRMHVGSDDAIKVWLNGDLVHDNPIDRPANDYQENFPVTLKQGRNILLVAVYNGGGYWSGFFGFDKAAEYTVLIPDATEHPTQITGDVNQDGIVSIEDLVFVASRFGETGENAADVNGDGEVNREDIIAVLDALEAAAAPTAVSAAESLQRWIDRAKQRNPTDARFQKGITVLQNLLTTLRETQTVPKATALLANYPNSFNPETWIPYRLATAGEVSLTIFDARGTLVRHLPLGYRAAGRYERRSRAAYWDGRNPLGEPVASGVYFYTLTAGDFSATRKMLIRK